VNQPQPYRPSIPLEDLLPSAQKHDPADCGTALYELVQVLKSGEKPHPLQAQFVAACCNPPVPSLGRVVEDNCKRISSVTPSK
jgi:hypothetical protein